jgi:vacuolar-type H+-ATPase subunit I/STV1
LEGKKKGEQVNVEVIRDKGTHSLTVTVELEGPQEWHADTWNFQAPKMKMKQQIEPKVKIFTDKIVEDELQAELQQLKKELKELQKELEELKEEVR